MCKRYHAVSYSSELMSLYAERRTSSNSLDASEYRGVKQVKIPMDTTDSPIQNNVLSTFDKLLQKYYTVKSATELLPVLIKLILCIQNYTNC